MNGTTLGYADESAFVSYDPQACRLFVTVETQAQLESLVKALASDGQIRNACVVKRSGE